MAGLASGRLRSRVTVQAVTPPSPNAVGQYKPTYSVVGTYWAEVITTGGDETMNADQLKAAITTKITMRQVCPISPGTNRILYNGRTFNIISVVPIDNLSVYYELMCKELVGT